MDYVIVVSLLHLMPRVGESKSMILDHATTLEFLDL
jgi:hypothetical protein